MYLSLVIEHNFRQSYLIEAKQFKKNKLSKEIYKYSLDFLNNKTNAILLKILAL
jgi:hypothetical protein